MKEGTRVRTLRELWLTINGIEICIPSNTQGTVTEIHNSTLIPKNSTIVIVRVDINSLEYSFFYDELQVI